jgi:hypothetical protein
MKRLYHTITYCQAFFQYFFKKRRQGKRGETTVRIAQRQGADTLKMLPSPDHPQETKMAGRRMVLRAQIFKKIKNPRSKG